MEASIKKVLYFFSYDHYKQYICRSHHKNFINCDYDKHLSIILWILWHKLLFSDQTQLALGQEVWEFSSV